MKITYRSVDYSPDLVTGRYVRRQFIKEGHGYKVFETATSKTYGPGQGNTLREYIITDVPPNIAALCKDGCTHKWPLE